MQRESEKSKMSKISNRSNNNRLSMNNNSNKEVDEKDMNAFVQKYGNYLQVDNNKSKKSVDSDLQ